MATDTNDTALPGSQKEALGNSALDQFKYWLTQVELAFKREKAFRKDGGNIIKLYEGDMEEGETSFNILYTNTETLLPAVYSNLPRPVVRRRFGKDPVSQAAAQVVQRLLEYYLHTDDGEYPTFDQMVRMCVRGSLVPGRGPVEFSYEAVLDGDKVSYETVCGRPVKWNRMIHGYATSWNEVPWVGFELSMTVEELTKNFGEAIAKLVELDTPGDEGADGGDKDKTEGADPWKTSNSKDSGVKLATVYKIWNKVSRQVIFLSPGYNTGPLKVVEDPLKLVGFYPFPQPLMMLTRLRSLTPNQLYRMYQAQAEELNRISTRIVRLLKMLKVRGFYDGRMGDGLKELLDDAKLDGTLIPANTVQMLVDKANMDQMIWLFPLEKVITVLQQLYTERQQCQQVIYQITGLSDILRGSSVASETATAQDIKDKWGSIRLKTMQKAVSEFARDSLRVIAEIAVTKLGLESIKQITQLDYPTQQQKVAAQQLMVVAQTMQAQQAQLPPQQPGMPAEQSATQAPSAGIPPEQLQKAQLILSQPAWEDIIKLLQDDRLRTYAIDIEDNSMLDPEIVQDRQDQQQFMATVGQFLNGVGPLVTEGVIPFEAAKVMLLAIAKTSRFGSDLEEQLQKMQAPKPKSDGNEAAMAKVQADAQAKGKELDMKGQLEEARLTQDAKVSAAELALKQRMAMAELAMKERLETARAGNEAKLQERQQQHTEKMAEKDFQHKVRTAARDGALKTATTIHGAQLKTAQAKSKAAGEGGGGESAGDDASPEAVESMTKELNKLLNDFQAIALKANPPGGDKPAEGPNDKAIAALLAGVQELVKHHRQPAGKKLITLTTGKDGKPSGAEISNA